MIVENKFLLRKSTGDQPIAESDLRDWLQRGQCKAADFLYDFSNRQWVRVGDHPALASFFSEKPMQTPERRVIYFLSPGGSANLPQGPFSTKEIQQRAQLRELCASTWVFVDGDKEWRQVKNVKILADMLPALPADHPAPMEAAPPSAPTPPVLAKPETTQPSISLEVSTGKTPAPTPDTSGEPEPEREEITMAMDMMGLNLHSENASPPPAPPKAVKPSAPLPGLPPKAANAEPARLTLETDPRLRAAKAKENAPEGFDGITAEIPMDPIWLVKQANSEKVSGPFRFLDVIKYLEEGKLTKNDKISRVGTKAFNKIQQQYEFNVKYSVENVIENGQERQKILIRRRHPRIPYMTGVQIVGKVGMLAGTCVNISAGGILMEAPKAEFNLGEIIEIKILPGLITKPISCKALIIGKIPKIPPGYALKFEDLKQEDKDTIEFFIQETLTREKSKKS